MKIQPEQRNKANVNKLNNKVNDIYSFHSHYKGGAAFDRGTSSVVSFVVAMNRVDVVDLVVDLVDVGLVDVVLAVFSFFAPRPYF